MAGGLNNGEVTAYAIHPEDFGMATLSHRTLSVETPKQSKPMPLGLLFNDHGAC